MTLPLEMTLGEVRAKVLLRAGIADSAAHNANLQAQVDEYIRDAHAYYYNKAGWYVAHRRTSIALAEGVSDYDWPDDSQPGTLSQVMVYAEGSNIPLELIPAPVAQERFVVNATGQNGMPRFYEYKEGGITLTPAPSALYTTLEVDYKERQAALVADGDRLQADSNLVIQRAVLDLKVFFGQPGVAESKTHLLEMERDVLSRQNNRKVFSLTAYYEPRQYGTRYRGATSRRSGWAV